MCLGGGAAAAPLPLPPPVVRPEPTPAQQQVNIETALEKQRRQAAISTGAPDPKLPSGNTTLGEQGTG